MTNPRVEYKAYNDAVAAAALPYEKYWIDRFAADGINFKAGAYGGDFEGTFGRYNINMGIYPRHREGAVMRVLILGQPHRWHEVKIMSDSGYKKFLHRIRGGWFN